MREIEVGGHKFSWCRYIVALWAAVVFFTGCIGYKYGGPGQKEDHTTAEATALHASLREQNSSLRSFKGLGTISLTRDGQKQRFRAAWAVLVPDKLRLQLMGIAGRSVFTFSCDGKFYYFVSNDDGKVYKKRAGPDGLKRFVKIPIGAGDLITLLSGRPMPVGDNMVARLEKNAAQKTVLVLHDSDSGIKDSLCLNDRRSSILEIERAEKDGALIWRAALDRVKGMEGYPIPTRITFADGDGSQVGIDVARFWANPVLSEEMFVIGE